MTVVPLTMLVDIYVLYRDCVCLKEDISYIRITLVMCNVPARRIYLLTYLLRDDMSYVLVSENLNLVSLND